MWFLCLDNISCLFDLHSITRKEDFFFFKYLRTLVPKGFSCPLILKSFPFDVAVMSPGLFLSCFSWLFVIWTGAARSSFVSTEQVSSALKCLCEIPHSECGLRFTPWTADVCLTETLADTLAEDRGRC